jgi:hypothetical protein
MSNYPPPGQPHPDQPSDPWQEAPLWGGQTGTAPYGEPSGYIGEQHSPAPVGYPPPGQPPGQPPVPGQPQPWQAPQPASSGGLSTMAIALITALVVVVCGAGVLGVYYYSNRGGTTTTQDSHTPTPTGSGKSGASASPTSGNPTTGPSEQDFKTAAVGQCLQNRGTNKEPDMHIVECVPGTYQVLARFDGTTDENKCDGVPGLTARFHYGLGDTKLVYCLKKLG